ncbi:MAG: bifunctional phosphopantothenoylcysteine decarboxylase/phosphopantothenate--cysteine ligase CoaBC [Myxococcaceae bacterium]|nr:bifunctional phosphopantothenoylcysteine decarboxylase/phosphopantothenate--cysteine ligase CoaBC [Myxococcaceae bacterium]
MSQPLAGRNVAVAVGGGIAAYKACDFVRELRRQGAEVRVAMTRGACEFVTPLTLQNLSGHPVFTDTFEASQDHQYGHLQLARWADLFVVAPATADLLARIRAGLGNDAVTTTLLAFRGQVLLAPAMNTAMWEHPETQATVQALAAQAKYRFVGPVAGPLADGDVGMGRLAELPALVEATVALAVQGPLAGKSVLVTAGPTREFLDPVRFLSNPSTGKMGLAMGEVARALGAQVTVVLGPTEAPVSKGLEVVRVTSADEMLAAVMPRVEVADVFVAAAAVSDWKAQTVSALKTKKGDGPESLALVRTPDVLATASAKVHENDRRPLLVGFAAETNDVEAYARGKLERKRLDLVVANDVSAPGSGFGSDTNRVVVFGRDGEARRAEGPKREVARAIWDVVLGRLK